LDLSQQRQTIKTAAPALPEASRALVMISSISFSLVAISVLASSIMLSASLTEEVSDSIFFETSPF